MSRSGYEDDLDPWQLIRWRGQVASAIRGKRGQALLRDMAAALDAMPVKRLIEGELVTADGECCALGSVALARGADVSDVDPDYPDQVAEAFGIAECMAMEIEYVNDECAPWRPGQPPGETPEQRWTRVRAWVAEQIKDSKPEASE